MSNIIKYTDIYQRLMNKLIQGCKLTKKEAFIHDKLCHWIAVDYTEEHFTYNEDFLM